MKIPVYFYSTLNICFLAGVLFFSTGKHVIAEEPMSLNAGVSSFQDIDNPQQRLDKMLESASTESNARIAVLYAEMAIHLADSLNMAEKKFEALMQSGIALKNVGDYTKSIDRMTEAAGYVDQNNRTQAAIFSRNFGETHRAARNFATAISMLNEALNVFIDPIDTLELCKTYNRLAATYLELIIFSPKRDEIVEQFKNPGSNYVDVLPDYPELKIYSDSVFYFIDKAMQLAYALHSKPSLISTRNIQAVFYSLLQENERALAELDSLIVDINAWEIYGDLSLVLINKAYLLQSNMSRPEEAIPLAYEALEIAQKEGISIYKLNANEILFVAYEHIGDYRNAYKYLSDFHDLWTQIFNDDLTVRLMMLDFDHQLKIRDMELESRKRMGTVLIVSAVLIILVLSVLIMSAANANNKKKSLLEQLHAKNTLIARQNEELSAANATKDKFFSIIAHDLRSPFSGIIGFGEVLLDRIQRKDYTKIESYAFAMLQSSRKALELLTNLLMWSRSQTGALTFNPRKLNIGTVLKESVNAMSENAQKKGIAVNLDVPPDMTVHADYEMLGSILRNLLSNAVKFTHNGGSVGVRAEYAGNDIMFSISDNGIGIPEALLYGLFSIDNKLYRKGTDNELSTGLGLTLCQEFVEKHGGRIWAESKEGKGSVFSFTIPVYKHSV